MFRYLLIPVFLFGLSLTTVNAQELEPDTVPKVEYTIVQPEEIATLSQLYHEYNTKRDYIEGYRIQIMYTDIRDEVYQYKGTMYKEFPELASYVEYEPPYYKLRIGDFKTRLEATHYLHKVIPVYTGAFIVHDKIKAE